jgi:hypothetical protein
VILLPALLGFVGTLLALRRELSPDLRLAWIGLLIVQIAAALASLQVMRTMSFAHVAALPGNAMLLAALFGAAQRLTLMPARVLATTAAIIFTPYGGSMMTATLVDSPPAVAQKTVRYSCAGAASLRSLNALPRTTLFTPLDIGAHVLVYTKHTVVATGHHRNISGMSAVLHGLLAPPAEARAIVQATGATHLAYCPDKNEVIKYARNRPASVIAALQRGVVPNWLERVPLGRGVEIRLYRIVTKPD